ncbi:MAG: hypothetical protein LBF68_02875 [Christensenellaceae bacterium]|jgi:hypothetical protein|nr:hypothetical protein [Christensenellaceae bacterium]
MFNTQERLITRTEEELDFIYRDYFGDPFKMITFSINYPELLTLDEEARRIYTKLRNLYKELYITSQDEIDQIDCDVLRKARCSCLKIDCESQIIISEYIKGVTEIEVVNNSNVIINTSCDVAAFDKARVFKAHGHNKVFMHDDSELITVDGCAHLYDNSIAHSYGNTLLCCFNNSKGFLHQSTNAVCYDEAKIKKMNPGFNKRCKGKKDDQADLLYYDRNCKKFWDKKNKIPKKVYDAPKYTAENRPDFTDIFNRC